MASALIQKRRSLKKQPDRHEKAHGEHRHPDGSEAGSVGMPLFLQRAIEPSALEEEQQEMDEEQGELGVQAKLSVGDPDDEYEREADQVADQVMRMPELGIQRSYPESDETLQHQATEEDSNQTNTLQAKPLGQSMTPFGHCQPKPMKCESAKENVVHAKATAIQSPARLPEIHSYLISLNGRGQPLSKSERTFFEPRFGSEFSQVRIHTDRQAAEAARAVQARAFTLGQNLVFAAGQFQPRLPEGRRLLAHELTHVMQQNHVHQTHLNAIRDAKGVLIKHHSRSGSVATVQRQESENRYVKIKVLRGQKMKTFAEELYGILHPKKRKGVYWTYNKLRNLMTRSRRIRTRTGLLRLKPPKNMEALYAKYCRVEFSDPQRLRNDIRRRFKDAPEYSDKLIKLLPKLPRKPSWEEIKKKRHKASVEAAKKEEDGLKKYRKQYKGNLFALWMIGNWVSLRTDERVKRLGILDIVNPGTVEGGFESIIIDTKARIDNLWNVFINNTCVVDLTTGAVVSRQCCNQIVEWMKLFSVTAPKETMASNLRNQLRGIMRHRKYRNCKFQSSDLYLNLR